MFCENNFLFDIYYKPKDVLNGDMIYSKILGEKEYLCVMIDAMEKGLTAAMTAINSISFVRHATKKAIEYNDFNYKKLLKDFVEYVKSILIENETLCANFMYIKDNKVFYANFGFPPIFTEKDKIKSNNFPIRKSTGNVNIDVFDLPEKMLSFSDGIIESPLKFYNGLDYSEFIRNFNNINFLKDIITDFKQKAIQSDDISLFLFRKDNFKMDKIFEKEFVISKGNINSLLKVIENYPVPQKEKIIFILQELFMNVLEHSILNINSKTDKENKLFKLPEIKIDENYKI